MALEVSLCWTLLSLVSVSALISVPDLTTPKCYISEGDLNIGVIAQVYDKGPGNQYCGNQLENEKVLQGIEAVVWAINQVNDEASPLLRGIRLGYVVLDNCGSELTSVAQALAFVPQENVNDPASSSASQASFCRPRDTQFDVVGVVGFEDGALARAAANVLALFNIPVISSQGSPEDVEGAPEQPREHDYLFYMTPPDELQGQAMVQLLRDHNWTYSALIYSEGSSGEKAAAHIQRLLPRHNMCLAMSVMMETGDRSEEFQLVLDRLVDVENARVVMLFLTEEHVQEFYDAVSVKQLSNKYIWVGSETLVTWTGPEASGGFAFLPQLNVPKSFSDYYRSRTPVNNERNPWMRELWSMMNNCTWTTQDPLMSCESQAVPNLSQAVMGETARYIDSVYVLVEALDEYITASCRSAFNDPSVLPSCLDGTELLPYIQNIDILGRTGQIQFGEDGVAQTGYLLQYFDSNQWTTIGEWSKADGRVSISDPSYINWNAYSGFRLSSTPRDRAPPSVCSLPCHTKEYQVQGSSSCCWSCNRCRADHIINAENSSCVPCAFAMWPDAATSRVCEPIPDDYMGWGDSQAIAFWFFSIVGMLACIAIGVVYFLKRTNKLIVACNIELSVITLVGAFLTYMTMLLLLGKPNSGRCGVERFGFDNALAFLVVPLMVKMNRSFRIYQASRKSKKTSVVFVGRASQLAFCIGVLLMQVGRGTCWSGVGGYLSEGGVFQADGILLREVFPRTGVVHPFQLYQNRRTSFSYSSEGVACGLAWWVGACGRVSPNRTTRAGKCRVRVVDICRGTQNWVKQGLT